MTKLLKFEFRKLIKGKMFYIINLIIIVLITLTCLTNKAILDSNVEGFEVNNLSIITQAFSSGMILTLSAIFIALFASEDESLGVDKNIYSKGYSRSKVYIAKYLICVIASLVFAIISIVTSFILGDLFFDSVVLPNNLYFNFATQIIILIALASFYFPIAHYSGKAGSAIAFVIIAPMGINIILTMLDSFLNIDNSLTNYWLDSFLNKINGVYDIDILFKYVIYSIIYIVIFGFIGNMLIKRKVK